MGQTVEPRRLRRPGVGSAVLALATLLWGTTFILTKQALPRCPVAELLLGRFVVAAVLFLPFLRWGRQLWRGGVELGLLAGAGYAVQTVGLQSTTVGRSAFIGSLNVIFVAILSGIGGRRHGWRIWAAVLLAIAGVGLLSDDGGPPNVGDAWTLACAIVWAVYILRLEAWSARLPTLPLTAIQLSVIAAGAFVWTQVQHPGVLVWPAASKSLAGTVLYLGAVATAFPTWLQTLGQKSVSATRAAVLYTLEPLWAGLFAFVIAGQAPGPRGWVGGAMIIAAALFTQMPMTLSIPVEPRPLVS